MSPELLDSSLSEKSFSFELDTYIGGGLLCFMCHIYHFQFFILFACNES